MSKTNSLLLLTVVLTAAIIGCANSTADDGGAGEDDCPQVCEKIQGCVGGELNTCLDICADLTLSQQQCVVDAATCAVADGCLQPGGEGEGEGEGTDPNPCSRCSATQACVREGQDYTCKNTVQSCNDDSFPNICDCLYDGIGDSVEGRQLCPDGVTGCNISGGKLSVDCR